MRILGCLIDGLAKAQPARVGLAVASLLFAATLGLAAPVAWADNTITGKVTDAKTHAALANMCVTAAPSGGGFLTVQTDGTGAYTIGGLGIDSYEVFASDCFNSPPAYSPVDYTNIQGLDRNIAHFITFKKDGLTRKNINFKLPRAAYIDVTVVDCASGVPVTNVLVAPYGAKLDRKKLQYQTGFADVTSSDPDPAKSGKVLLTVALGGTKLGIFTPDPSTPNTYDFDQYFDKKPDFASADVLNLTVAGATMPVTVTVNNTGCSTSD